MLNPDNYYVYALLDPETHDVFYVGKGKNNRWKRHFQSGQVVANERKKQKALQLVKKHKVESCVCILDEGVSNELACELEKLILSDDELFSQLLNLKRGGSGWGSVPNEVRDKIRDTVSSAKESDVAEVKWLLENTEMTYSQISNQYDSISESSVGSISQKSNWTKTSPVKPNEAKIHDRLVNLYGSKNPNTSLTKKEAGEIKWLSENTGVEKKLICEKYGVSRTTVWNISKGKTWSEVEKQKPISWEREGEKNELR